MNTLKLFAVLLLTSLSSRSIAQEELLTGEQIPQQIQSYVKENFPNNNILTVKKDKELAKIDYEVKLDNNIELVFDKKLSVKDIESKSALPKNVIPAKIEGFISSKYPNNTVVGWEKDRKKQKIDLDNDVDLYFDLSGNFIKMGD